MFGIQVDSLPFSWIEIELHWIWVDAGRMATKIPSFSILSSFEFSIKCVRVQNRIRVFNVQCLTFGVPSSVYETELCELCDHVTKNSIEL